MPRTKNLLLVIGAPFDPLPDTKTLLGLLEKKKAEWGPLAARGTNVEYYQGLLDNYKDSLRDLKDPVTAENYAEDAKREVYTSCLDKAFGIAAQDGKSIPDDLVGAIRTNVRRTVRSKTGIVDFDIEESVIRRRAKELGYKITVDVAGQAHGDKAATEAYEKYCKKKLPSEGKYRAIRSALSGYGVDNLYEFAAPEGYPEPRFAPSKELLAAAAALKAAQRRQTAMKATIDSLEAACRQAFATEESRQEYDAYLNKVARNEVLDALKDKARLTRGTLRIKEQREGVEELAPFVEAKKDARALLIGYCREQKIDLEPDHDVLSRIQCRCGHVNDKTAFSCGLCGLPLVIECPHCHAKVQNIEDRCPKCSHETGVALERARDLCRRASSLSSRLDFKHARACIEQARSLWPNLTDIRQTSRAISQMEQYAGPIAQELEEALGQRRYVAAIDIIRRASAIPNVDQAGLEVSRKRAVGEVSEAEKLCNQASRATDDEGKAELYDQAFLLCSDCVQARSFLASHPPTPPLALRAEAFPKTDSVRISWQPSKSRGNVTYELKVSPRDGSFPETVLSITTANAFEHRNVPIGVGLDYSITAIRGGVASRSARIPSPIVVTPGLSDLNVTPAHKSINLSWPSLHQSAQVVIHDESGSTHPIRTTGSGYTIIDLINGQSYTYSLEVEYNVVGVGKQSSERRVFSATPLDTTSTVDVLKVHQKGAGTNVYEARWEGKGGEIRLFGTSSREFIPVEGTALTLAAIGSSFDSIHVDYSGTNTGTFVWAGKGTYHVFAASVFGESVVIGAYARISGEGGVKIKSAEVIASKLIIDIEFKRGEINGFTVLVRDDHFAQDIEEDAQGTTRRVVGIAQYDRDGRIIIPGLGGKKYYISVFARSGLGADTVFSDASEIVCDDRPKEKIVYTMDVHKSLLGGTVTLTFRSESGASFTLPAVRVEWAHGRVPHMTADAVFVEDFGPVDVDCEYTRVFKLPKGRDIYFEAYPVAGASKQFVSKSGYGPV